MNYYQFLITITLLSAPSTLFAQAKATIPDPDPEIERKTFILPEGFEVNLYAADPLLAKPIQMNFDPQGRLWVACSEIYPHIKPGEKANDKILILEDTKGVGKADKVTIFADGLLIPTGVEPGDGGAYVANSTELLHVTAGKDGKADKKRIVLSGFGTEDTHHILHTLRWGPDGMLYFNQSIYIHSHIETPHGVRHLNGGGIWRFRPETMELDVFVRGFINSWGHHIDRFGQSFITDGANGEGITHGIPGAGYPTVVGMTRILHGLNPGSPKHCGLEILSGSHLPEDYRGNLITNDFRGHRVCRFVLKEDGSTYASQEKTELIKSNHPAFRPIDVKMGPDGAIYIADWYNPIIQHGEIDFRDPRRDHTHGRIWRVTAKGRPLVKKPDFDSGSVEGLLKHLTSPEDWIRQQAKRVLKERGAKTVTPALKTWLVSIDPKDDDEQLLLEGLWVYQSLDVVEPDLLKKLLKAQDGKIRAAAVRVLTQWNERVPDTLDLLKAAVSDEHPRVRMEAVRGLGEQKSVGAMQAAMTAFDKPVDRVLDYCLWLTAKDLEAVWLPKFKEGTLDFNGNIKAITCAVDAAGANASTAPIVKLLESKKWPADQEQALWMLLANIGGSEELSRVLDRAVTQTDEARGQLVKAVEQSVRQRRLGRPKSVEALRPLLDLDSSALPAIRLIGLWRVEEHRERLQTLVASANVKADKQDASFETIVGLGGPKSRAFLEEQSKPTVDARIRRRAIAALAEIDLAAGARQAADFLMTAKATDDLLGLYTTFLNRKDGAAALVKALDGKKLPPDVAQLGLRAARATTQDLTALVAALTKAGDLATRKRDVSKMAIDSLVADVQKNGNAARGELLYRRKDLQCLNCHSIGGAGGLVGPDLASIGASAPVDYLVESLLIPTKAVKEGYHSLSVETLDGKVFTGVKVRESKTELVLRGADDKEIVIPVKMIEEKRESRSLMPDALVDPLSRQELVDLTKFLSELGKLGPYSLSKARVIRRWQALLPTPDGLALIRRSRVASVAENDPAYQWESRYVMVSGDLPLDAIPSFAVWKDTASLSVVRTQLDVTTAGKIKLKLNSAAGVSMYVGANPVEIQNETVLDLKTGVQTLLFAIDLSKRKEPLHAEIEDVTDSAARVTVVGGK